MEIDINNLALARCCGRRPRSRIGCQVVIALQPPSSGQCDRKLFDKRLTWACERCKKVEKESSNESNNGRADALGRDVRRPPTAVLRVCSLAKEKVEASLASL